MSYDNEEQNNSNVNDGFADEGLTKDELLRKLAGFEEDDLRMALRAATAQQRTREEGLYFLHYFLGEDRDEAEAFDPGESQMKRRAAASGNTSSQSEATNRPGDSLQAQAEALAQTGTQAVISIPISATVMNPGQMVHGGVTALLCDNVMGMASFMSARRPGVTLDLSVRYHLPGRGSKLTATGEVVHAGGRVNSTRCEVRDDRGNLVATATGSFYHGLRR